MKPATNRLAGLSYASSGLAICMILPPFMITIRSPIVIASTWSCVTYTLVVRTRWCSRFSSVRMCTRSLASRFDSGSSNKSTPAWRQSAAPTATRWR